MSSSGTRRTPARIGPAPQGAIESIVGVLSLLIQTFGFPGTVLFGAAWFVNEYATPDQKRRIIERYILGEGLTPSWPLIVLCVIFVLAVWAQGQNHKKKMAVLQARLDDVAAEKSRLQEVLAHRELRHGDEFNAGEDQ